MKVQPTKGRPIAMPYFRRQEVAMHGGRSSAAARVAHNVFRLEAGHTLSPAELGPAGAPVQRRASAMPRFARQDSWRCAAQFGPGVPSPGACFSMACGMHCQAADFSWGHG